MAYCFFLFCFYYIYSLGGVKVDVCNPTRPPGLLTLPHGVIMVHLKNPQCVSLQQVCLYNKYNNSITVIIINYLHPHSSSTLASLGLMYNILHVGTQMQIVFIM